MNKPNRALLLALSLVAGIQSPSSACGPFFDDPTFQYGTHPDMPLRLYAGGQLGILGSEYARSYLAVAWRYLNNSPLSPAEQKSVVALWDQRLNLDDSGDNKALKAWQNTFQQYGKGIKYEDAYQQRSFNEGDTWFTYTNCPNDAFLTATQTAKKVADTFGATSNEMKDWLKAQNQVFCNCSGYSGDGKPLIPAAVPANLDARLKPYRDYQIAAANFYSQNFDKAAELFKKIEADKTSPFHELAAYLEIRAMVRKATVASKNDNSLLADAEKKLVSLIADKSMSNLHEPLNNLLGFVKFKLGGAARFSELAKALSSNQEGAEAGNNLCDYTFLFDKMLGEDSDFTENSDENRKARWTKADKVVKADDMSEFILAFQSEGSDEFQQILKKWHESKKLYWLVALMSQLDAKSPEYASLSAESDKIPNSSPAYLHLQYCLAALEFDRAEKDKVKARCEKVLADKTLRLPPGTRNQFMVLRSKVANSFPDFLQYALQRPVAIESGWSGCELPTEFEKVEARADYEQLKSAFPNDVTAFLNMEVPVNLLKTIPSISGLPAQLKSDALQSLWVRCFILKDYKTLETITASLKQAIPSLAPMLSAFESASTPEAKQFAACLMILKNPGMRPVLSNAYGRRTPLDKIDDFQDNWWDTDDLSASNDEQKRANADFAGALNAADKLAASTQLKALKLFGDGAVGLGKAVLVFAEKSPQDPRVPEALYLTVHASKFCNRSTESSAVSKKAFNLLHSKYPKNPWTIKTKYYY